MKKRFLLTTILSLFFLLVLSACSGEDTTSTEDKEAKDAEKTEENKDNEETSEPVEIEFWHAMSGPHEEALQSFVETFNSENESITVKAVNQGGYDDLEQKIMASAKAKTLPTMSQAVTGVIPEYINNDFVEPLNTYMEDEEIGLSEDERNDFMEIFRESSKWDDTYYSVPFSKSTRVMFYNKTILEENGFDVPETWQDVREISEAVTKDNVIGMGFENSFEAEFQAILKQLGGTYIDEEAKEAQFASEKGIEAMTFINDMIQEGIARTAGEDQYMSNPFGRGDVAMYIGSSAGIPHIAGAAEEGLEWGVTTNPTWEGEGATTFAGNDIVMFNQSEDAEKEAAWKFMKYLTSPEVTAEWAMKSGYLPVRSSALELEEYKTFLEENPAYAAASQQVDTGFFTARVTGGDAVRNIVLEELDKIVLGEKTVEDGLTSAQERSNEELKK
ncbi:ABC transporter substrate-binding protein [Pontibacillus litoralis]|uniref:ABC transporter substrate-binding protein n=1 Tax=Pontibacillus litoralis JSM 072002 TaxID=1385512 RepID=A0A0A5G890_9BACI|nr:ABC transporter substrate-binding protein [Pontibacillus litoralis]KGX87388.1 hypothetical protein N784_15430 [Pontibacillus litoralis JSM 072002]